MSNLDTQILNLVSLHGPVKARNVVIILAEEFGKHVDRSDVNSALYRMKSEGKVEVDTSFKWSAAGVGNTVKHGRSVKNTASSAVIDTPVVNASIQFTSEQQAVIDLDPREHLLIRGQAGSGKTTVLAARAGKIISAMSKGSLLFLTYNTALTAYVKRAFVNSGMKGDIDVRTFHDWAKGCAKELGANFEGWVATKERSEQLKLFITQAIKELGNHRLYNLDGSPRMLEWWGEEIAWLFGQHVTRLSEYRELERINRGTSVRVTNEDKNFIWYIFELYLEWLEESQKEDYDNPAGLILKVLEQQGKDLPESLRYDHVMVDEVQDFDRSWLLAVVKIPKVSLSLAGDLAQKIYRRNFTWKSVGIQVQGGRSRRLAASHRTTLQIMDVAECLLKDNSVIKSEDYSVPVRPQKNGDKVCKLVAPTPKVAYDKGYDWIAKNFKRLKSTSVVVALPFSKQLYPAQKSLEKRGLTVKAAKGTGLGNFCGGIVVTTYHQLKGLEFDHVVIMGLHDSQYPARLIDKVPEEDQKEELEMAKRVLYVAMTRAKKSVALIGSDPFCRLFDDVPEEYFEIIE